MQEIEVKVRLRDLSATLLQLKNAGVVLSKPKEQHDVVYCLPENRHKANDPSVNWLRVRTQDSSIVFFTLKRSVEGNLNSIEHETVVENAQELEAMLTYMGYVVFSDLVKIRRTGMYKGIEVCLDEVPPLGSFLELEKMSSDTVDGARVQAELLSMLEEIGIDYQERIELGYDELMNEYLAKTNGNS